MKFYFSCLYFCVMSIGAMDYKPVSTHPPRESLLFYRSIITEFENNKITEDELKNIFDQAELKSLLVNTQDDVGNTLLHIAAKKGTPKFMTYLLSIGAQPTMANIKGQTPVAIINKILRKKRHKNVDDYYSCLALLTTHLEHTKQIPLCPGCWPF